MIHPERIERLNHRPMRRGEYVMYWMQASQRAACNHALEYAVERANALELPLLAVFGVTEDYPEANERHYAFMLEGLLETRDALRKRGVQLAIRRQAPDAAAIELAERAAMVVTDRGYTNIQTRWRRAVARAIHRPLVRVESDVVVPVDVASVKHEYAARTLRPKIHKHLDRFLAGLAERKLVRDSLSIDAGGEALDDLDAFLADLRIDRGARRVTAFRGGTSNARRLLRTFRRDKLPSYGSRQSDPSLDIQSHQSPYLHFGQISPLEIALTILADKDAPAAARQAYMEQLIVRRELSVNHIHHNQRYASYQALPSWARATLRDHERDKRPFIYRLADLEHAATHDAYWNAAMREMLITGKMHNYMRMYWGKKVIEWTRRPRWAFRALLHLNNTYFLDGRDPNSWTSVAWCFGLHDRPWAQRPIFGTVRYLSHSGLTRKFDMDAYVAHVDALGRAADRRLSAVGAG